MTDLPLARKLAATGRECWNRTTSVRGSQLDHLGLPVGAGVRKQLRHGLHRTNTTATTSPPEVPAAQDARRGAPDVYQLIRAPPLAAKVWVESLVVVASPAANRVTLPICQSRPAPPKAPLMLPRSGVAARKFWPTSAMLTWPPPLRCCASAPPVTRTLTRCPLPILKLFAKVNSARPSPPCNS